MVDARTWPAYVGVLFGTVLFAIIFFPLVIVHTRRYGGVSKLRLAGAAAFAIYLMALLAYTLLPIPAGDLQQWCAVHGYTGMNLDPLTLIRDIGEAIENRGALGALRSAAFLQGAFNVLLFVPLGMFLRRYVGWGLLAATVTSFGTSLLIEVTQYTGIYGLIGCSYRYADIDDLIANTLGGVIGALLAPVVLRWMPQSDRLQHDRTVPRPVTAGRRWLGMAIDAFLYYAVTVTIMVAFRLGNAVGLHGYAATESGLPFGADIAALVLVFLVPAATRSAASWGERAVWLAPVTPDRLRPPPVHRRLLKLLGGGGLWAALLLLSNPPLAVFGDLGQILVALFVVVCVSAVLTTASRRGLSGALAGLTYRDTRTTDTDDPADTDD